VAGNRVMVRFLRLLVEAGAAACQPIPSQVLTVVAPFEAGTSASVSW